MNPKNKLPLFPSVVKKLDPKPLSDEIERRGEGEVGILEQLGSSQAKVMSTTIISSHIFISFRSGAKPKKSIQRSFQVTILLQLNYCH